ncbi:helix-turn-helix domain-containing protein [Pseudalkalibacillus berkeleyi]|uniref:Helix-turn-helix transcriptional regulator n=1 Tax=Pseudalkalibacillus berkeleyi TaxID=1069813 RepID=A0ABS9GY34_9BACL|nr:helix-turn-helix domain-containing protein [Pseudalkalibacillus berkeleyi]MCF6136447.1 helix-turn-helix transcriptional regulator [Pseudalkalibacillus berkeleyi]
MDFIMVGEEVRKLRKTMGISQKELCKGICTQAEISKIENNQTAPLANTLYHISKKLGVKIDYFFESSESNNYEYIDDFFYFLRNAVRKKDYVNLQRMIRSEKNNPLFQNNLAMKQLLRWHEGICIYHVNNDAKRAIELLNNSLEMTNHSKDYYIERELEILNSIGIIYLETEQYNLADETFQKALIQYKRLPFKNEKKVFSRLCYNYSNALTNLEKYNESISIAKEGIQSCIENESFYLIGELYFQVGRNYHKLNHLSLAQESFQKAIQVFSLQNKKSYVTLIQNNYLKSNSTAILPSN